VTGKLLVRPVWVIDCDYGGCPATFRPSVVQRTGNEWSARMFAKLAGWQVRPARGKGARSAPDLCTKHKAR
jgi:hypothetical protein